MQRVQRVKGLEAVSRGTLENFVVERLALARGLNRGRKRESARTNLLSLSLSTTPTSNIHDLPNAETPLLSFISLLPPPHFATPSPSLASRTTTASISTLALRIYFGPVPLCSGGARMPCLHEENSFPLRPRA